MAVCYQPRHRPRTRCSAWLDHKRQDLGRTAMCRASAARPSSPRWPRFLRAKFVPMPRWRALPAGLGMHDWSPGCWPVPSRTCPGTVCCGQMGALRSRWDPAPGMSSASACAPRAWCSSTGACASDARRLWRVRTLTTVSTPCSGDVTESGPGGSAVRSTHPGSQSVRLPAGASRRSELGDSSSGGSADSTPATLRRNSACAEDLRHTRAI